MNAGEHCCPKCNKLWVRKVCVDRALLDPSVCDNANALCPRCLKDHRDMYPEGSWWYAEDSPIQDPTKPYRDGAW